MIWDSGSCYPLAVYPAGGLRHRRTDIHYAPGSQRFILMITLLNLPLPLHLGVPTAKPLDHAFRKSLIVNSGPCYPTAMYPTGRPCDVRRERCYVPYSVGPGKASLSHYWSTPLEPLRSKERWLFVRDASRGEGTKQSTIDCTATNKMTPFKIAEALNLQPAEV